jgi:hypothetical protein
MTVDETQKELRDYRRRKWSPSSPHCQKGFPIFPSPAGMSLTKLSLDGNYDVIYKLFLHRESLVSDIPAGDGNIEKLFLQCTYFPSSSRRFSNGFIMVFKGKQLARTFHASGFLKYSNINT